MIHYAMTDEHGYLVAYGSGLSAPDGATILERAPVVPVVPPGHKYHLASSTVVDLRSLDDVKAAQWSQIKTSRDRAESSGFVWDGSMFDSDPISQQRITSAAQIASSNSQFVVDWTLSDNTVRTLNASEMLEVCLAMGQHINEQHMIGRTLRQQIESAADVQGVTSVVWPK